MEMMRQTILNLNRAISLPAGAALHVQVSHIIYPVTNEVLHQVYDIYGAEELHILVADAWRVEALVWFRARGGAEKARGATHGHHIYDGGCLLEAQHVQPCSKDGAVLTPTKCSMLVPSCAITKSDAESTPTTLEHVFPATMSQSMPSAALAAAAPPVSLTATKEDEADMDKSEMKPEETFQELCAKMIAMLNNMLVTCCDIKVESTASVDITRVVAVTSTNTELVPNTWSCLDRSSEYTASSPPVPPWRAVIPWNQAEMTFGSRPLPWPDPQLSQGSEGVEQGQLLRKQGKKNPRSALFEAGDKTDVGAFFSLGRTSSKVQWLFLFGPWDSLQNVQWLTYMGKLIAKSNFDVRGCSVNLRELHMQSYLAETLHLQYILLVGIIWDPGEFGLQGLSVQRKSNAVLDLFVIMEYWFMQQLMLTMHTEKHWQFIFHPHHLDGLHVRKDMQQPQLRPLQIVFPVSLRADLEPLLQIMASMTKLIKLRSWPALGRWGDQELNQVHDLCKCCQDQSLFQFTFSIATAFHEAQVQEYAMSRPWDPGGIASVGKLNCISSEGSMTSANMDKQMCIVKMVMHLNFIGVMLQVTMGSSYISMLISGARDWTVKGLSKYVNSWLYFSSSTRAQWYGASYFTKIWTNCYLNYMKARIF
uniref:OSJNBa0027O01.7 protein n=1 Tax=Oryza sativa subsp. japonica TaxID=39947 RepID=Q7XSC4_ORYSJ|nr:OSJNBa0027O01.7 [Oryza sativa Japonica Group]